MRAAAAAARLEALLGAQAVAADAAAGASLRVRPADAAQVAAVVAWARAERLPLAIGESHQVALPMGREPARLEDALRLDLARLERVRFYEPQDLTVGLEAGMTAGAIQEVLGRAGQFLPLDTAAGDGARLGAILAAHRSGPLRQFYGTVRDFIIGIEFVGADGRLAKGGGRVVKNVAGYDLMRLQIGARGTLGVITAAHFRVFPRPATTETWRWPLAGWEQAEALRRAFARAPLRPLALEASGPPLQAAVRFAGAAATRARWRRELTALGERLPAAAEPLAGAVEDQFWRDYAAPPPAGAEAWRLVAPAAAAVPAMAALARAAEAAGSELRWRGRLGLGVFEFHAAPGWDAAAAWPARGGAWVERAGAALALTPMMAKLRAAVG